MVNDDFVIENNVLKRYKGPGGDVIIPDGIITIGYNAFTNLDNIIHVIIPDSVTSIKSRAFQLCSDLKEITIPESVTEIGWGAFNFCKGLLTVNLPQGFNALGCEIFAYCRNLKNVNFYKTDSKHGNCSISISAFRCCSSLEKIDIPYGTTSIGHEAFSGCINLKSVAIPESVTEISCKAFKDCASLDNIMLPESLRYIGDAAFMNCSKLKSISIPEGIDVIASNLFRCCDSLTKLNFAKADIDIGYEAFYGCTGLADDDGFTVVAGELCEYTGEESIINTPSGVNVVNLRVFNDSYRLTDLIISDGVRIINGILNNCPNLRSIKISPTVTSIDEDALLKCDNLTDLIADIDLSVDRFYKKLVTLTYLKYPNKFSVNYNIDAIEKYFISDRYHILKDVFKGDMVFGLEILLKAKKITKRNFYKYYLDPAIKNNADKCISFLREWEEENITSEDKELIRQRELSKDPFSVTALRKIWNYKSLEDGTIEITGYKGEDKDVVIPEVIGKKTVTSIGAKAFYPYKRRINEQQSQKLSSITSITIPDSIVQIMEYAFASLVKLNEIIIPDSVKYIWSDAFYNCKSLSKIKLPSGLDCIGTYLFDGCYNLSSITLPDSVKNIYRYAFNECSSLTSMCFPEKLQKIEEHAFKDCRKLRKLDLPENIKNIGAGAFYGCRGLKDSKGFVLVNNVLYDYIGSDTEVIIPDGVTTISVCTFRNNQTVSKISVPESTTMVDGIAFMNCTNLKEIIFENDAVIIDKTAFSGCSKDLKIIRGKDDEDI